MVTLADLKIHELEVELGRLRATLVDTDQIVSDRDAEIERLRAVLIQARLTLGAINAADDKLVILEATYLVLRSIALALEPDKAN